MKLPQVQCDIDFEFVNSYTTDLSGINNIIYTVDDKSTWINDNDKEVIRQIHIGNDSITTTKDISLDVLDMTLTSNNDILLSMFNSSYVKLSLSVSPLLPHEIHVTSDNDIIGGVTEPGPFTPTEKSIRAPFIFGMDGKQQHTYQYDRDKHRLLTLPDSITTNNSKSIIVVDSTSGFTGGGIVGWEGA